MTYFASVKEYPVVPLGSDVFSEVNYSTYLFVYQQQREVLAFSRFFPFPVSANTPKCLSKQSLWSPAARNERSPKL